MSKDKASLPFFKKLLSAFLFSFLMASCTTLPQKPLPVNYSWQTRATLLARLQNWELKGKIGIQTAEEAGSASIDWQQRGNEFTVSLYGPLGAHAIKLIGRPGQAIIQTADGKQYTATNPEQLLSQQTGWHLPVSYLRYWVRGLPVPNLPYQSQFDMNHRLNVLIQQGWLIQFLSYTRSGSLDLPTKIYISSSLLKTKLAIYDWRID